MGSIIKDNRVTLTPRFISEFSNIKRHGGKRKGAGRPKLKPEQRKLSKTMRIPIDKISEVEKLIGK